MFKDAIYGSFYKWRAHAVVHVVVLYFYYFLTHALSIVIFFHIFQQSINITSLWCIVCKINIIIIFFI